jgi:hypothetical protein
MKTVKIPKDGKKYIANGRRFSTLQEVKGYASSINCYVHSTENYKGLILCDLGSLNARENMPS